MLCSDLIKWNSKLQINNTIRYCVLIQKINHDSLYSNVTILKFISDVIYSESIPILSLWLI